MMQDGGASTFELAVAAKVSLAIGRFSLLANHNRIKQLKKITLHGIVSDIGTIFFHKNHTQY
eukprot:14121339-Ditylum_brightwellii.AAC.1